MNLFKERGVRDHHAVAGQIPVPLQPIIRHATRPPSIVIWCSNFIAPNISIKGDIAPRLPRRQPPRRKGGGTVFDRDRFIAEP